MFRPLGATSDVARVPGFARARRYRVLGLLGLALGASAALIAQSPADAAAACDRSATTSTFASESSAASPGQTICLASGSYGTFAGTGKAVTIRAADGAAPSMKVNLGTGDTGFTLDGMTGMGGVIGNGATNVTIRNSSFTDTVDVAGASTDGIVFDGNSHNWNVGPSTSGSNAKIYLENSLTGTLASPSVTVQNSVITNGDLDGVHFGGGSGYQIVGNRFSNLCDMNANHTDAIQFDTSTTTNVRIAGNYIDGSMCGYTQGITSFDAGTSGVIIEDNVVDIRRPWGIELYADRNSIVRHNTVRWYPDSGCVFSGIECGQIDINRRTTDPAGTGTQVYDNLTRSVNFVGGSTGTQYSNVNSASATYVGPTTTYAGFALSSSSLVGLKAATDGLDAGALIGSTPAPNPSPTPSPTRSPSPTPSPTPTPTPTTPTWTAPSNVTVGSPVVLDGTASTGDGPLSCTWSFENADGTTIWDTADGCKLIKTFQFADTKYVKLIVTDADGDTDASKQSFVVGATARPPDQPATAVWTAPSNARAGSPVTLDGTRSTGDGPITCTWTFEDESGSTLWEPAVNGCTLQKTFMFPGTKYVKLTVTDADGDTDANKQSFTVG